METTGLRLGPRQCLGTRKAAGPAGPWWREDRMRLRARRAAVSENKYIFYEHQDREAVRERAFPARALGLFPEFTARPGDSDTGKTAVGTGHVARALLAAPKPHAELRRMDHQAKYEQGCAGPSSPRKALRVVWSGAPALQEACEPEPSMSCRTSTLHPSQDWAGRAAREAGATEAPPLSPALPRQHGHQGPLRPGS